MFKVIQHYQNYKILYGDGRPVIAKNKKEVMIALKHYFGLKHNAKKCPACDYTN